MANQYLKPQKPLKDLNSEDYFYPLTTHDQVIIGNSRLSSFLAVANNKLTINGFEFNANLKSGEENKLAFYSNITTIQSASKVELFNDYLISNNRNGASVNIRANGLLIYGQTYGNTANQMLSNTAGVFRFGDGGPQIIFNTSNNGRGLNAQAGALIFTDHDAAATGTSFHFVTTEASDNYGGDLTVTAPRFRARKGLTIGQNSDNASYNLYVNGTSYFNGATTINNTLRANLYEDDISWGGKEAQNTMGPLDYTLNDLTRGNIFAGINPAAIKIESSSDNGSTWTEWSGDYTTIKKQIFTTSGSVRLVQSGNIATDSSTQTRITIQLKGNSVYMNLRKIHIGLSTSYSQGCKVTIKGAKGASITTFDQTICENVGISGWSGWNSISCNCTIGSNDSQIGALQFIFSQTSIASDKISSGLTINSIRGYGEYHWSDPSNLSSKDRVYNYDENLIAHFTTGVTIQNDSSNNAWDALLYVKTNNNADWGIKIAKSSYNYGLYVESTGTNLLKIGTGNALLVNNDSIQTNTNSVEFKSLGNNRASVYINTVTDNPNDLWFRTGNTNRWSISARHSGESYAIGMWAANATAGWVQKWFQDKHSEFFGEIKVSNMAGGHGQIRFIQGNYGVICRNDGSDYYFLLTASGSAANGSWNSLRPFRIHNADGYVYVGTRLYGAVWNDFAEFRQGDTIEPGRVVVEQQNGIMTLANERLAPGAKIISDTYGHAIGETKTAKTPIAVSGRVLVYPYQNKEKYKLGAAVCSAPGGTVDIMTRKEICEYPERIIGTVSEIPTYDIWYAGGTIKGAEEEIQVNGRIWVYVR